MQSKSIIWKLLAKIKNNFKIIYGAIKPRYTRFYIYTDSISWVLDNETRELAKISRSLNIFTSIIFGSIPPNIKQCIHYVSHFDLLKVHFKNKNQNRVSFDYFHGKPEDGPEFKAVYKILEKNHNNIHRIRVSYSEMKDFILNSGIEPHKVHRIPIGINLNYFYPQTTDLKINARKKFGIPENAIVIGSFQKDGNGWGNGDVPKLIKGPDIMIETLKILKNKIPEIYVFLTGPSRGYVKKKLAENSIPFSYTLLDSPNKIGECYLALDAYLISSRVEGGPKAILEAMASQIPLVTTRVGQAMDLVEHGRNGWIVDVADSEALAYWIQYSIEHPSITTQVCAAGRITANKNSYEAQIPLWQNFFTDYIYPY